MEFTYFKLDENPRQFKNLSLGEYEINLRIEWNIRARCWYVLGYINNDLVLRNTKFSPNKVYNFDQDNDYDLPYNLMITTNFQNADWNDETLFVIFRDALANPVKGITDDYIVIDRSFATSSNTHSKRALRSETNKYLFDVKPLINDGVVTIICDGAGASFETIHLPQGRWDFTINGFKQNLAIVDGDYTNLYNALAPYGVHIATLGDDRYTWVNSSDENVRIEAVYPYANGFDFNVDESSNDSIIVTGKDSNGWVNGFAVCLVPASSFTWNIQFQNVVNGVANYTGTQGIYKSTASLDLTNKTVQSFSNETLKEWQAVKDAVHELTGATSWLWDDINKVVKYEGTESSGESEYIYKLTLWGLKEEYQSLESLCDRAKELTTNSDLICSISGTAIYGGTESSSIGNIGSISTNPNYVPSVDKTSPYLWGELSGDPLTACSIFAKKNWPDASWVYAEKYSFVSETTIACWLNMGGYYEYPRLTKGDNPNYDPNYVPPQISLSYTDISQKIISNSMSSSQGTALLAQTYLEEVAKTLVTVEDLSSQLEANKTI